MAPQRRGYDPFVERLDERCLPATSGLTPAQLIPAYDLSPIAFLASNGQRIPGNGAGQTIALIEAYHNPYLASDLATFDQTYNLPAAQLNQVNLAGSHSDDGWAEEAAMDVEWAHALAPGATIVVVEARSPTISDLIAAVNYARSQPGVSVVSMSWGTSEFKGEAAYDPYFMTPAGHTGITFIAAAGDSGAWPGAQWPAASRNVLAVGGTTLQVVASGSYLSESAWSGGGGGTSRYEAGPAYQAAVSNSGRRSVPDVSFVADPYTGVSVYYTAPSSGRSSWTTVGGTSLGAPAWAAIIAIIDQGLSSNQQVSLDGATQTLPLLYKIPANSYHDITSGFNGYPARPGYDLATGLGSPDTAMVVRNVLASLSSPSAVAPSGGQTGPQSRGRQTRVSQPPTQNPGPVHWHPLVSSGWPQLDRNWHTTWSKPSLMAQAGVRAGKMGA
jgi:subtilase family serine protease